MSNSLAGARKKPASAWEAGILPLNYARKSSLHRGILFPWCQIASHLLSLVCSEDQHPLSGLSELVLRPLDGAEGSICVRSARIGRTTGSQSFGSES